MQKRTVKLFALLVVAIMFVFSGVAQGYHTHDTAKQYTLNELCSKIKARDADYGMIIKNHIWLNEKCIWFFEERTGIELSERAKQYITLGAITADYDIAGSSPTKDYYNDVGWDVELGDAVCLTNLRFLTKIIRLETLNKLNN